MSPILEDLLVFVCGAVIGFIFALSTPSNPERPSRPKPTPANAAG